MKKFVFIIAFLLYIFSAAAQDSIEIKWLKQKQKSYSLVYTEPEKEILHTLLQNIESSMQHIATFFGKEFQQHFTVTVFPNRNLLDKEWQQLWADSSFHSECWMVASGIAAHLHILSTRVWKTQACEHNANDTVETRKLICHELVHVYHAQINADKTFSKVTGIDWLVEGAATYVSMQYDSKRKQQVLDLLKQDKTPSSLDDFWKGSARYALAGSAIAFIDAVYGRQQLFELLKMQSKEEVLSYLQTNEKDFLLRWKNWMLQ
jgi:hypothetical protein